MIVDQGAMERPLYTGLEQWAAIRQAAAKGGLTATTSTDTSRPSPTPSTRESSSPQTFQHQTASSYLHVPLQPSGPVLSRPPPPQQPSAGLTSPARWYIPPQPVCKGGEKPTPVCGKYSPALRHPPKRPRIKDTGAYRCPRCHAGYVRIGGVRSHFPRCVAVNGNPDCDAWTDHYSWVGRKRSVRSTRQFLLIGIWGIVLTGRKWSRPSRSPRPCRNHHPHRHASGLGLLSSPTSDRSRKAAVRCNFPSTN